MSPKTRATQPQPSTPSGRRSSTASSNPASLGSSVPQNSGSHVQPHAEPTTADRPSEEWVTAVSGSNSNIRKQLKEAKESAALALTQQDLALARQASCFSEERATLLREQREAGERHARESSLAAAALDDAQAEQERLQASLAEKDLECLQQQDSLVQIQGSTDMLNTAIQLEQERLAMLEHERDKLAEQQRAALEETTRLASQLAEQRLVADRETANADRAARRAHAAEEEAARVRAQLEQASADPPPPEPSPRDAMLDARVQGLEAQLRAAGAAALAQAAAAASELAKERAAAASRVSHAASTARSQALEEQSAEIRAARASEASVRARLAAAEGADAPPALLAEPNGSDLRPVSHPHALGFGRGRCSPIPPPPGLTPPPPPPPPPPMQPHTPSPEAWRPIHPMPERRPRPRERGEPWPDDDGDGGDDDDHSGSDGYGQGQPAVGSLRPLHEKERYARLAVPRMPPILPPYPLGADAYDKRKTQRFTAAATNMLKKQGYGLWLNRPVTERTVNESTFDQQSMDAIGVHAMLTAACVGCVPDDDEHITLRNNILQAARVPGKPGFENGVNAFSVLTRFDVDDDEGIAPGLAFTTYMIEMSVPMDDDAVLADLEVRSGRLTQLAADAAGLVKLPGTTKALALRAVIPERFRRHAHEIYEKMAAAMPDGTRGVEDYDAFYVKVRRLFLVESHVSSSRALGASLSHASRAHRANVALSSPLTAPLGDRHRAYVAQTPSPPPAVTSVPTPTPMPPPPAVSPLSAAAAEVCEICEDEDHELIGEYMDAAIEHGAVAGQTWALAAQAADPSVDCRVCKRKGHGLGESEFLNTECLEAVNGPAPDSALMGRFGHATRVKILEKKSAKLVAYVKHVAAAKPASGGPPRSGRPPPRTGPPRRAPSAKASFVDRLDAAQEPGYASDGEPLIVDPDEDDLPSAMRGVYLERQGPSAYTAKVKPTIMHQGYAFTPDSDDSDGDDAKASSSDESAASPSLLQALSDMPSDGASTAASPGVLQSFPSDQSAVSPEPTTAVHERPSVSPDAAVPSPPMATPAEWRKKRQRSSPTAAANSAADRPAVDSTLPPHGGVVEVDSIDSIPVTAAHDDDASVYLVRGAAAQGQAAHATHRMRRRLGVALASTTNGVLGLCTRTLAFSLLMTAALALGSTVRTAAVSTSLHAALAVPDQPPPYLLAHGNATLLPTLPAPDVQRLPMHHSQWARAATPAYSLLCFALGAISAVLVTAIKCAAAAQYMGRVHAHATELAARAYGSAILMLGVTLLWLYTLPFTVAHGTLVMLRAMLRLAHAGAPLVIALLALHSLGCLGTVQVMAEPLIPQAAGPAVAYGSGTTADLYIMRANHAMIKTPGAADSWHLALNDTGCSEPMWNQKECFPVIDGAPSLSPSPSNVLISGAETTTKPPDGHGASQVIVQDCNLDDYISYSPHAWCTTSFTQSLISESELWRGAKAFSAFAGVKSIFYPSTTVPMHKRGGVYTLKYKTLDTTSYGPVPHGAMVAGLYRPRVALPPLAPDVSNGLACTVAVTRGRSTRGDLQRNHKLWHNRAHCGPRALAQWHKCADGVERLPESLAVICDACCLSDGDSHAAARGTAPVPPHEGTWCMDDLGPLPKSLFGGYEYFTLAVNPTTKVMWGRPVKSRKERTQSVQMLESWCQDKGHQFHHCNYDDAPENSCADLLDFMLGKKASTSLGCGYEHTGNATAENGLKTVSRLGRAFMCQGNVSNCNKLWPHALVHAVHVHNVLPTLINGQWWSPIQRSTGTKPFVGHLRALFCDSRVLMQGPERGTKIDPKREHAMFLGEDVTWLHQGWTFWIRRRCELKFSHEALFYEHCFSGYAGVDPLHAPVLQSPIVYADDASDAALPPVPAETSTQPTASPLPASPVHSRVPREHRPTTDRYDPSTPSPAPVPAPQPRAPAQPRPFAVGDNIVVPASLWPTYSCTENGGAGWTAVVTAITNQTACCRFTARDANNELWPDEWLRVSALVSHGASATPATPPAASAAAAPPAATLPTPQPPQRPSSPAPNATPAPHAPPLRTTRHTRTGRAARAAIRRLALVPFMAQVKGTLLQRDPLGITGTAYPAVTGMARSASILDDAISAAAPAATASLDKILPDTCLAAYATILAHEPASPTAPPVTSDAAPPLAADPKGRKQMLAHPDAAGFIADEIREINDFVRRGYLIVRNASDKPRGEPVYNWTWAYRNRPGDGVKAAAQRSRMCFDPRGKSVRPDEPTTAPSFGWESTCVCIALKVQYNLCWGAFDVSQAYMNHTLPDGKGYWMQMPPGHEQEGKLAYVPVAIYGAPPSGNQWFNTNAATMRKAGYIPIPQEPALFVKITTKGVIFIGINTDDGLMCSTSQEMIDDFRKVYDSKYTVKWGPVTRYGGVNIVEHKDGSVTLDQDDFLDKAWAKWRPRIAPDRPCGSGGKAPPRMPARADAEDLLSPEAIAANAPSPALRKEFMELQGDIAWLVTRTRAECSTPYSRYGTAMRNPSEELMQRSLENLAYMVTHRNCIRYSVSATAELVCMCDANLGRHRSQSGWCAYLANGPVIAKSKAQKCIVLSACESELVALSAATCDIVWLRGILTALGFAPSGPTPIFCDNTAAKKVAENPVSAKNLRHVARRHFFVQDAWRAGEVIVPSVESKRNRADVLTKLMDTPSYYETSIKNFLSTAP